MSLGGECRVLLFSAKVCEVVKMIVDVSCGFSTFGFLSYTG